MKEARRTLQAADPKTGMTVDELLACAQALKDAGFGDAYPSAVIKVGSGRIKRIEVKT